MELQRKTGTLVIVGGAENKVENPVILREIVNRAGGDKARLVVLTVAMVFDSVWGAAMVFLSLPVALGGVIAAFWFAKEAFTREAAVGVILVIGLAVHQSILLVDGVLQRRREGRVGPATVLAACRDRAGMIALITLTTLASPLPLAVGTESQDLFGAIALALVGGTLAGTLGALFLVPPLLLRRKG